MSKPNGHDKGFEDYVKETVRPVIRHEIGQALVPVMNKLDEMHKDHVEMMENLTASIKDHNALVTKVAVIEDRMTRLERRVG